MLIHSPQVQSESLGSIPGTDLRSQDCGRSRAGALSRVATTTRNISFQFV